jgi:hypothetical protein
VPCLILMPSLPSFVAYSCCHIKKKRGHTPPHI